MVGVGVIIVGHGWCWCNYSRPCNLGHGWCWCNYSRPWLVAMVGVGVIIVGHGWCCVIILVLV